MRISRIYILIISIMVLVVCGLLGCKKEEASQKTDSSLEAPITTGYESALTAHVTKPIFRPSGTGPAVWGPGDIYTFLATGEETNNVFFQFEAIVPAGGGPPPHIHSYEDESFYIVSGSLEILLEDTLYQAKQGDFVYIPRGVVHRFKNVGKETSVQLITFVPGNVEKFFREAFPPVTDRSATPPPITEASTQKLLEVGAKYGLKFIPSPPDTTKH